MPTLTAKGRMAVIFMRAFPKRIPRHPVLRRRRGAFTDRPRPVNLGTGRGSATLTDFRSAQTMTG